MGVRVTVFAEQALREAYRLSTPERVEVADEIAADARATAPVETGAFQAGIGVDTAGDRVFVVANADDSVYIEYGTVDTPAHATLTTAASKRGKYSGFQPR